jgi:hypothetical protein
MRRVAGFFLFALVAAGGCKRAQPPPASKPAVVAPSPSWLTIECSRPSLESLAKEPLDKARRGLDDLYRLQPDRRFLIAVGETQRLLTGASAVHLRVEFQDAQWEIHSGAQSVGSVPETPDPSDLFRLLSAWDRALWPRTGLPSTTDPKELASIRAECDEFEVSHVIKALERIDRLWKPAAPDRELVALAGHAFVQLSVQSEDRLEMADGLRGRALAFLTLSESLGAPEPIADKALLLDVMGYRPDAVRRAKALPVDDPVGLYIRDSVQRLRDFAVSSASDPRGRYLALLALASPRNGEASLRWTSARQREEWSRFLETGFAEKELTLPVLRTGLKLDSFEMNPSLAQAVLHAAFLEAADRSGKQKKAEPTPSPTRAPAGLDEQLLQSFVALVRRDRRAPEVSFLRTFESDLQSASSKCPGPFWDADSLRDYLRGYFYSGLDVLGSHFLNALSSVEGTQQFAAYLKDAPEGPAAQFSRWYGDLASIKSGEPPSERQVEDLSVLPELGAPALFQTYWAVKDYLPGNYDLSADHTSRLARRVDGRPAHQAPWTRAAFSPLMDMRFAERLCRDRFNEEPWSDPTLKAQCLSFLGDRRALQAIAVRRDLPAAVRAEALTYLLYGPSPPKDFCRGQFRALLTESGYDRPIVGRYVEYMEGVSKDYAEAQRVVEGFLSHHDESEGLPYHIYRGRLAHLMELQGDARGAWKVIEPSLGTGQGAVMGWAVEILAKLGRQTEAQQLARERIDRYPDDVGARADLAGQFWAQKRFSEAALVLDPPQPQYKPDLGAWQGIIAEKFSGAFAKEADAEVLRAFEPLVAQGVPDLSLEKIIPPLAAAGRIGLAFELQSRLKERRLHVWEIAALRRQGFDYLKATKGRDAALAWLRQKIPPKLRDTYAEGFYNERAFDLLWDAFPLDESSGPSEWVWLLRAAASALDSSVASRRGELLAHYESGRPADVRSALARYLLDLSDEVPALALAKTPHDRCEATYFLGVKAIARGRYGEASEWFHLCTALGRDPWQVGAFVSPTIRKWATFSGTLDTAAAKRVW